MPVLIFKATMNELALKAESGKMNLP